jgi:hypothetical protein
MRGLGSGVGRGRPLWIACLAVVVLLSLSAGATAKIWYKRGQPHIRWGKNCRTLRVYVPPCASQELKDAVKDAMTMWNMADAGWEFEASDDPEQADVSVHMSDLASGACGQAADKVQKSTGDTLSVTITMDDDGGGQGWGGWGDPNTQNLTTCVAHELGHTIGLDDVKQSGHVMSSPRGPNDDDHGISREDFLEAFLCDLCQTDVARWIEMDREYAQKNKGGRSMQTAVWASPDSDPMNLGQATDVQFMAVNPANLMGTVLGWDSQYVYMEFTANPTADQMEGYYLHIVRPGRQIDQYFGALRIGDLPYSGMPHAVAPAQVYQDAGLPAYVDASGSYHDDPNGELCCHWTAYSEDGTVFCSTRVDFTDDGADFWLPSETNTVELQVHDQWGNWSTATTTVEVTPRSSPENMFDVGWNYFSIPLPAQDPTPETVLGFDCSRTLWRWDVFSKATVAYNPPYSSFDIDQGEGYLLLLTDTIDISYASDAFYWLWEKRLGKQGWSWVGFPAVDELALGGSDFMDRVKVQYPVHSDNLRSAAEDRTSAGPWLCWGWPYWDAHLRTFRTFTPYSPFGDNVCRPWIGYLVYANVGTATTYDDPDQVNLCWPSIP